MTDEEVQMMWLLRLTQRAGKGGQEAPHVANTVRDRASNSVVHETVPPHVATALRTLYRKGLLARHMQREGHNLLRRLSEVGARRYLFSILPSTPPPLTPPRFVSVTFLCI